MDAETYSDDTIVRRSAQIGFYKANVESPEGRALAEKLGFDGALPTLVFTNSEGRELHRYVGFLDAQALNRHLDQAYLEAGLPLPK